MTKRQRPATARVAVDGMKLHRRVVRLDGRDHTVIGLRPGARARFSTNRFHDTWHVLSDQRGARLLARLLWGLAYQARPGTMVLIDRPFLTPTPFDADPADPIALLPPLRTPFKASAARALRATLPLTRPPDGTVRWRTHGLDRALADVRAWREREEPLRVLDQERGTVTRTGGMVVLRPGSPAELRSWAVAVGVLDIGRYDMDYQYLGRWDGGYPGEVQIFRHFRSNVGVARRARAEVLARPRDPAEAADRADPELLRMRIWDRGGDIAAAERRARKRRVEAGR
ncbi:hypothetical protein [Actinomadura alba]|uniref:Uncharacterized protein n=1 Tax=Actinomadura alba TaxID=406431 RepID=A0ABR7LSU2_9ACTN|nr:hypothetical protein [Actinomadura alba]MBC6467654.1 hypothetical protein [Actinomadura alba]